MLVKDLSDGSNGADNILFSLVLLLMVLYEVPGTGPSGVTNIQFYFQLLEIDFDV